MSFVKFFNSIEEYEAQASAGGSGTPSRLAGLANALVDHALEKHRRLEAYERDFGPDMEDERKDESALHVLRAIWQVYEEWLEEAEPLFNRVKRLPSARQTLADLDTLRDTIGGVRARLSVTPEEVLEGHQQARRGEAIPLEVLRNGLRARRGT
jgi:hypothetical protein